MRNRVLFLNICIIFMKKKKLEFLCCCACVHIYVLIFVVDIIIYTADNEFSKDINNFFLFIIFELN